MTTKVAMIRKSSALIAVAAIAAAAAPAALADPPQGHRAGERLVAGERAGSLGQTRLDTRPVRPDDRAGVGMRVADVSPVAVDSPVVAVTDDRFEWGDATIGAGFTIAVLLAGGLLALTIRRTASSSPSST